MQAFFENNWLSILSILIGITVSYVFYRLQKKDSASASFERKKHATNELLDVVESYIINKQRVSEHVIDNLIHASERDHAVALRPRCTSISLLQDVALRLQRSRHLDIPQKSEYSEKIEELIQETRKQSEPIRLEELSEDLSLHLLEIMSLVPEQQQDEVRKRLETLAATVERAEMRRDNSARKSEASARLMTITTALLGVAAAFATSLLGSRIFVNPSPSILPLTTLTSKLFPILGAVLVLVVMLQTLTTYLRIKRRSRENKVLTMRTDT